MSNNYKDNDWDTDPKSGFPGYMKTGMFKDEWEAHMKDDGMPVSPSVASLWGTSGSTDLTTTNGVVKPKSYSPQCYTTHKPILGGRLVGGNCSTPVCQTADVYVGLCSNLAQTVKAYPWEPGAAFTYYIPDMTAPKDPVSFGKLIDYLVQEIKVGTQVHVGCIGGHGRTGTVFAAIIARMHQLGLLHDQPDQPLLTTHDYIGWVRKNYCDKAVETDEQVTFLMTHYGAITAKAHKSFGSGSFGSGDAYLPVKSRKNIWLPASEKVSFQS